MIMDANTNVFLADPSKVKPEQAARMTSTWGDESWKFEAYRSVQTLFEDVEQKTSNDAIAEAFRSRLKDVARFNYVPPPMPMRNSKGAIVYYLYFASQNQVGSKIVGAIFDKYRDRGIR